MWIEIFKTGTHTDSAGREQDITEDTLDQIVSKYDPSEHEAPVVIGHPKADAPAYGWVEALKREGKILYAKLKDLVPEFVDMVKRGLFKKRSIALYPDYRLKHVGFLGAVPPAVKGLRDVKFREVREEGGITMYEFNENDEISAGERLHLKVVEFLESPQGKDLTYAEGYNIVSREAPDLARAFAEELMGPMPPLQSGESAGERLTQKLHEFMESPRGKNISSGEAFDIVCRENRELAEEFAEELLG